MSIPPGVNVDEVVSAYVTCALWSETDDDSEPLDANHDVSDIAPETLADMRADVEAFLDSAGDLDLYIWHRDLGDAQIGHDFWLTRNGHGAGFWDRFYDGSERQAAGDRLTALAKPFGESWLYIGDDGQVYAS